VELDSRKIKILQTIIDDYILTAAPVGSRTISKRSDLGLSSATIRNEMSDLEEMGYLDQPHTSAGRIPSDKAYRLYVDTMMKRSRLTAGEAQIINGHVNRRIDETKQVINETAKVLSELTNYTAMVMEPQLRSIVIKHIQLVPVTYGRALAVIVTDAGLVHDTIIPIPRGCGTEELEKMSRMLTRWLTNQTIEEAETILRGGLGAELSEHRKFLSSVAQAISQDVKAPSERYIALGGAMNLLMHPEYSDVDKARSMLSVLETRETLYRILSEASRMEFTITIGSENAIDAMKNSSVVTATYRIGDQPVGSFGIIGPTRMNYSKVLSVLEYMGQSLSEVFSSMLGDGQNDHE
jgi:heat-inducible transcriptional repressor